MEEGVVKYRCHWKQQVIPFDALMGTILDYRHRLYQQNLIGAYPESGIGFGNISCRSPQGVCWISGSQTGHIPHLLSKHIAWVSRVDISANELWCEGETKASSESLTHAAVYQLHPHIEAVIHVHHLGLWHQLQQTHPTSSAEVPYGTPEMAGEVQRLYRETDLKERKLLAMGGHEEGIISFGTSMEEAYEVLFTEWQAYEQGNETLSI
ncbi:MAG: class II aldolase/adducin family protein [Bacteroidota bacterium]